ncbi:MAG: DNA/RNA nuclease SfsA [Armatimonadetes bacterium]|nr:DNA/RNA nuclease SfsA [Armatimonadota bacterium]
MRFPALARAVVISRPNRFGAWVEANSQRLYLHVPNSGRLPELMKAGARLLWTPCPDANRKTAGDIILVRHSGVWVCVDARLPPHLLAEAVQAPGGLPPFGRCAEAIFEPALGAGRADLIVRCGRRLFIVETKSATLARGGVGLFPDAPTDRGRRHLAELTALAAGSKHLRPVIAFICARPDVHSFAPNRATDPAFADALLAAHRAGVMVVAYRCVVSPTRIAIASRIPVRL